MSSTPGSIARDSSKAPVGSDELTAPISAPFSPATLSNPTCTIQENKKRTIIINRKTPLLGATPLEITRALSYSHIFLLALNQVAGLVTWTSGEPWESFLLVASFWGITLYGEVILKYFGPFLAVLAFIAGTHFRRCSYSLVDGKAKTQSSGSHSETSFKNNQKSLDEVVETLRVFTHRCHIILAPLIDLIEAIASSKTSNNVLIKALLTSTFPRFLLINFIWIILSIKPFQLITPKRIVLVTGTLFLTWHSQPFCVTRAVLWRSSQIRRICSYITGLELTSKCSDESINFSEPSQKIKGEKSLHSYYTPSTHSSQIQSYPNKPEVRFTFVLYENQRNWVGLGWTNYLFDSERSAWTDEHLNPAPSKENFEFPNTEDSNVIWKWVEGSKWLVEGARETDEGGIKASDGADGGMGWIYYDNKVNSSIFLPTFISL